MSDTSILPILTESLKQHLAKIAMTIRGLSIDGVQAANSGHPGLPLGCAELGAYLYGFLLRHDPACPTWINRDRCILSAGHGSMWLYSALHLAGFNLSKEDLQQFRQLHSKTPGHPEMHLTPGVESSTGPLGQGFAHGVGVALGQRCLAEQYNVDSETLFSSKVYVLAGDGCIMEGVSAEAASFAGHLALNNLVVYYDANDVTLDGPLSDACSENTKMRFQAYGWDVFEANGHDFEQIDRATRKAIVHQTKPALIIIKTIIGKGSPNKAGLHIVHGAPLGADEVRLTKQALGLPTDETFYVPKSVIDFFKEKARADSAARQKWEHRFDHWSNIFPAQRAHFDAIHGAIPADLESRIAAIALHSPSSGRKASQEMVSTLAKMFPQIYCGSADLSCSDLTWIKHSTAISQKNFTGKNIKFGDREFGMAAIAMGLAQTGILPVIGTFLAFSDYMKGAIRLTALTRSCVIYQFTHDSILLGEDGPTHQPIEQLIALRSIPHLQVIRPSGTHEIKMAWVAALHYKGPTALILSRQNIVDLPSTDLPFDKGLGRGGYSIHQAEQADFTLLATGSELPLAMDVAHALEQIGKKVRVISMPCWSLFDAQPESYKQALLHSGAGKKVSIEAGSEIGWHKYIGPDGICIAMEDFGASAPSSMLAKEFGFTVEAILDRLLG